MSREGSNQSSMVEDGPTIPSDGYTPPITMFRRGSGDSASRVGPLTQHPVSW